MKMKRLVAAIAVIVVLCIVVCAITEQAYAQKKGGSGADKSIAGKKGFEVLEGSKDKKGPKVTKLQKFMGFGSIFVMIAVVKWL